MSARAGLLAAAAAAAVVAGQAASPHQHPTGDSPRISSETPVWSPDGGRLAFSAGPPMQHQIYVINADGTGARRLTSGEQNRWPAWSPDGRILFMSDRDGQGELYVMTADGSNQRRLTRTPAHEFAPAWSPTGHAIMALAEMPGRKQQLVRVHLDGRVERIDGDHLYYGRPAWLPDGSRLLVAANRDPEATPADRWKVPARLYRYSLDGQPEAVPHQGLLTNPWPSPDGRTLVYDRGTGNDWSSNRGQWNLWTMRICDGRQAPLTQTDQNDWGAAWSPDGRWIAYSSGRDRVYALTIIAPDGSGRRTLTRTDRLPDAR